MSSEEEPKNISIEITSEEEEETSCEEESGSEEEESGSGEEESGSSEYETGSGSEESSSEESDSEAGESFTTTEEGEKLIRIVNKLQDAFTKVGMANLDLPQIAVVGCQSSDEYGQFLHKGEKKYYDYKEIEAEIVKDTDRITGKNKGLSPIPINLKLYSPNVVNLTMIDLPSVTKIAVGDQPEDIEKQINDMVLNSINRPNCIILAVTPANKDLANSDSLKLAKQVDPKRQRSVGVLTKLDLMNEGTDAVDILEGRLLDLKFIGVVNRSQKDLQNNKDVKSAQSTEQQFFKNHPKYMHMAHVVGSKYLAKVLNNKLINHIQKCLPKINKNVEMELESAQKQLQKLGVDDDDLQRKQVAFSSLSGFSQEFKNLIDGTSSDVDDINDQSFATRIVGGARIRAHFIFSLPRDVKKLKLEENLADEKIKIYIQNAEGAISRLGVPEKAFHWAIRVGITKLMEPCRQCVLNVEKELIEIITATANKVEQFEMFPMLKERILDIATTLVSSLREPTLDLVTKLVNMELAYINFDHPNLHIRKYTEDKTGELFESWLTKKRGKSKKWQHLVVCTQG
ncbi:vacuolar protein sorting-associated protein [Anaeramoeba flamelloides]|uniref:Vacuolar protein sorting-associated protein n=1 Tax=Anaeramoeba flamelloides TaxID=1746091 RepID=A0ABQ8Y9A8_9EUKA|nr:vacuolar protein sorting-associated protein [Anaeramoeba flamelloides]